MRNLGKIMFLSIGLVFSSCGKQKKEAEKSADTDSALWGTWHSNCVSNGILSQTKTERNVKFDAAYGYHKDEIFYLGDQCEKHDMTVSTDGSYSVQGNLDEDKSLKKLN